MAAWDNDPVVTLDQPKPWENDPVVDAKPKPWEKDPIIGDPPTGTEESHKALSETPVSPVDARLQSLGVDTAAPESFYKPEEHPTAEAIAQRGLAFAEGAGVPTSLQGLKEMGKFLVRSPIQDVKDIYGDITQIPSRIANFGQTIAGSPAATVYREPLSPEAFGIYGTAAGMLAPALMKRGGELNAVERGNAQVQEGTAPLGVEARPEGEIPRPSDSNNVVGETSGEGGLARPPQETPQPVGVTETLAELKRRNIVTPGEVVEKSGTPITTEEASQDIGGFPSDIKSQKWYEEYYGEPAKHASAVRATESGSLLDADGNEIKPGDQIKLHFMGGPADMPEPWTLESATNKFSSVNYKLNPSVTVKAANGTVRTYDWANQYSPRKAAPVPIASKTATVAGEKPTVGADVGVVPTGIANKYLEEVYGDGSPAVVAGKGPKEWKALGQARLDDFQATGNPVNDPYAVLTNLRVGRVPVAKIPHDVSLLRAEHQRLVENARQSEGTPEYPQKAQAAFNMATAIKEVAHGPGADLFRALQEHDAPRYDNVTDFDQATRERLKRESTPEEKTHFRKIAQDVRTTSDAASKEVEIAQRQVQKYRGKEKMSFEDAAKSIHDQITQLVKDCGL